MVTMAHKPESSHSEPGRLGAVQWFGIAAWGTGSLVDIRSPSGMGPIVALGGFCLARSSCAPCKGAVVQWVRIPPGNCRSSR